MERNRELGQQTIKVLKALDAGCRYGFEIMQVTGNHSATVYRSLRGLERRGFVRSAWEKASVSEDSGRPRRRYYEVTRQGRTALADAMSALDEIRAIDSSSVPAVPRKTRGAEG